MKFASVTSLPGGSAIPVTCDVALTNPLFCTITVAVAEAFAASPEIVTLSATRETVPALVVIT